MAFKEPRRGFSASRTRLVHDWRFDLLRVFACFGVVVLHATGAFQSDPPPTVSGVLGVLLQDLSRAAVPLFFMTAGYFGLKRIREPGDAFRFWRKRARRLWFPTLFWSVVYLALYLIDRLASGAGVDATDVVGSWLWLGKPGAGYHLWFLYVLIALELVAPWLKLWFKNRLGTLCKGLCLILLAFSAVAAISGGGEGGGGMPQTVLMRTLACLPWYFLGFCTGARVRLLSSGLKRELGLGAIFGAGVGLGAMVVATFVLNDRYANNYFLPPCMLLFFGLWFYAISRPEVVHPKLSRPIERLGSLSFGVYVVHIAVLEVVSRAIPGASGSFTRAFLLAVVTFVCSAFLTALLKKLPGLRRTL